MEGGESCGEYLFSVFRDQPCRACSHLYEYCTRVPYTSHLVWSSLDGMTMLLLKCKIPDPDRTHYIEKRGHTRNGAF